MAAMMRLRVEPSTGDAYEVNVTPKVIVTVERHFSKPMTELFGESPAFEPLCWAAWKATQLSGRVVKPFDEWLDDVESIEAVEADQVPLGTP